MLNAAAIKLLVEAIVVSLFPVSLVATIIEGQQWLFQYEFINRLPAGGGSLRSTVLGCYPLTVPKTQNFKRIKKNLRYGDGEFVYKSGPRDTARIIYQEESIDEKTRMILYKDVDENNSKRKSYKQSMDEGENGYTPEGYEIVCEWAGVYVLQTTTDEPAAEVFSDYKDRWSIETYNNYVKNDADFNDLKLQDYYNMQGFNFIMLVTGLIHSKLNDAVKSLKKSSISTYDILLKAGHMRMVKQDDHWALVNTRTKDLTLLKVMGYIPEVTYPPIAN